jgi:Fungal specific transcription factor domain
VPQKKGPKGSRAKVISELRETQRQTGVHRIKSHSPDSSFDFNTPPMSPMRRRNPDVMSQQMIDGCIEFFFTNMYPTMPILHKGRLQEKVAREMDQSVEPYCLITSLCAFMMIQPGMALPGRPVGVCTDSDDLVAGKFTTATTLLEEVLRLRKTIDYVENPTLETVQTSLFLFACYFGLDQHNKAWYHLREATTLAQIVGMQEEPNYLHGDSVDSIMKRRLYWLLFITERAYALQRHRPLTLYATIELPNLNENSGDRRIINGFLHMINLFRPFDDTFIGLWNKARNDCSTAWLAQLQQQLSDVLPPKLNSTATQAADIVTSQQWLRTMVWQLSITNGYLSSTSSNSSMTFKYPIEIAKDLMADVSNLPQQALEVHGIGLIEKLFDVACTVSDVIAYVPLDGSIFEIGPSEYLNQFLCLISKLRGGSSRFLPLLLAKISEDVPGMTTPISRALVPIKNENDDESPSPYSTQSAPPHRLSPLVMPILSPSISNPDLLFSTRSPLGSDPSTPLGMPTIAAPVPPRSVPQIQFDSQYG